MKRTLSLAVALLIAGGLSAPALAQGNRPVIITSEMSTADLHLPELTAFGKLAAANPRMKRSLAINPRLANSRSFLKRNPELSAFFAKYPGSKERFEKDPGNYLPGVRMFRGRVVTWHHTHKSTMAKKPAMKTPAPKSAKMPEKSGAKSEKSGAKSAKGGMAKMPPAESKPAPMK